MASPADRVTDDELVDALAAGIADLGRAELVVKRAGYPLARLSRSDDPLVFWERVIDRAGQGALAGGVRAVVVAAKEELPSNDVLTRYLEQLDAVGELFITRSEWSDQRERIDPFPGHHAPPPDSRELPELIVIGTCEGGWVRLRYRTGYHADPFAERELLWDAGLAKAEAALAAGDGKKLLALGLQLGQLLLGELGDETHHEVMRALFRVPSDDRTTPLCGAARCRLVLDEPLEALPWRLAALRDRAGQAYWLTDEGWTFEHGAAGRSSRVISLPNPCSIMFVVPQHGRLHAAGAVLQERAMERLGAMWPSERKRLGNRVAVVHGHGEALRELQERTRPDVVVVLGRLMAQPTPSLEFRTGVGEHGTSEFVSLAQLIAELAAAEVKVAYLATPNGVTVPAAARRQLPCLVMAPAGIADERDTVEAALGWLRAMLAEGLDPVRALHRAPAEEPSRRWCGMRAYADFRSWTTPPAVAAAVDLLARRRIDRTTPRAVFIRQVDLLVKDERRRVEAFVAHGRSADRVEWLGTQLWQEYLDREPSWLMYHQRVPFPEDVTSVTPLGERFERLLVDVLELEEGEEFEARVAALAKERGWPGKPFVYWLDWGARLSGIEVGVLEDWLQLAKHELPRLVRGLKHVRVVSTLAVVPADPERFRELTRAWARDLPSDQVSITALEPLELVKVEDLERYLRDPRISACPERLVRVVAEVIIEGTGGDFDKVVARVETAERGNGWLALAEHRPAPPPAPTHSLDRSRKI